MPTRKRDQAFDIDDLTDQRFPGNPAARMGDLADVAGHPASRIRAMGEGLNRRGAAQIGD